MKTKKIILAISLVSLSLMATAQICVIPGGSVGIGTASPTAVLHTLASGAKTAAYTGNLFTNIASSSTASINKIGVEIQSTGTWNGLYVFKLIWTIYNKNLGGFLKSDSKLS